MRDGIILYFICLFFFMSFLSIKFRICVSTKKFIIYYRFEKMFKEKLRFKYSEFCHKHFIFEKINVVENFKIT